MDETKSKVTKLKRKTETEFKPKPWNQTTIQNHILTRVSTLSQLNRLHIMIPDPFASLYVYRPYPNDPDVVVMADDLKQVKIVPEQDLNKLMGEWYRSLFAEDYGGEAMGVSMQRQTTEALIPYLRRFEPGDIKIFAFRSENVFCWTKINWDLLSARTLAMPEIYRADLDDWSTRSIEPLTWGDFEALFSEHCPSWFTLIKRMKNQEAFCAWMGALMDRDIKTHQFLYLRGDGGDGKGTIIRALNQIFTPRLMLTANIPEESSARRFFGASLEGKRILACPEVGGSELFTTYLLGLTGGDAITVEPKGKPSRQAENNLAVIKASNVWPKIPNTEAARRRIILVPTNKNPDEPIILNFETKLVEDAHTFFSICYYVRRNMPSRAVIEQDRSVYVDNFDKVEGDEVELLENYFHIYRSEVTDPTLNARDVPYMSPQNFTLYVKQYLPHMKPRRVRELLHEKFGLGEAVVVKLVDGTTQKRILGVTAKKLPKAWEGADTDRKPVVRSN